MSTDPSKASGGSNPIDPSGVDDPTKDDLTPHQDPPAKKDVVSYETHQKLLKEKKAADEKLRKFEQEAKTRESKELEEKENFKKLWETARQEADEWKGKHTELDTTLNESVKLRAFLDTVAGEVPKQYWPLIDTKNIPIDPETRQPDEHAVEKAVKEFEKNYPDVIKKAGKDPLPGHAPRGGSTTLSYKQWLELPLADKKKRQRDVDPKSIPN